MYLWFPVILAALLSLWSIFRERRLLSRGRWLALAALRLAGLSLLAAAMWELDPWGAVGIAERPLVLAIVDGSQSMSRRDGMDSTRYQRAMADARSLSERRDLEVRVVAGNLGILAPPEKAVPSPTTDMGAWLGEARRIRPDAVVMLSDGNNNAGEDPAEAAAAAGFPVYAFGYGPVEAGRMPAILDAWAPERTGVGKPVEVMARAKAGERPATLWAEGAGQAARLRLEPGEERTERIIRKPESPGMHRVSLYLAVEGDTVDRRTVAYRADRDKIRAVCLCGSPDWNLRFLRQAAATDPDIELRSFVRRQGGWEDLGQDSPPGPMEGSVLAEADLLILMNMRPQDLDSGMEKLAIESSRKRGVPLLFWGPWWDGSFRSREIYNLLPLRLQPRGERVQARLAAVDGQLDRIMPDTRGASYSSLAIGKMPPLWSCRQTEAASKTASVMAAAGEGGKKHPVLAWWYQGRSRIAQLAVEDLWSWKLGALAGGGQQADTALYGRMVRGLMRWLAGVEGQAVEVGPERHIYYAGEEVRLRGRYQTPAGAGESDQAWSVTLRLESGRTISRRMAPWKPGEYQVVFPGLEPGTYTWTSALSAGGKTIDRSQGKFWVEPNFGEMGGHVQQSDLMKRMAELSGGSYWDRHRREISASEIRGLKPAAGRRGNGARGLLALGLAGLFLVMAEWLWRRRWGLK